jgi:hypothetical protein
MSTHQVIVSMSPPTVPMVVKWVFADERGTHMRTQPVLAWLLIHMVEADGSVDEQFILPGILNTEFNTVDPANDMLSETTNAEMVGVYPEAVEPSTADLDLAYSLLRQKLRLAWRDTEQLQPKRRELQRAVLAQWAAVLPEVA